MYSAHITDTFAIDQHYDLSCVLSLPPQHSAVGRAWYWLESQSSYLLRLVPVLSTKNTVRAHVRRTLATMCVPPPYRLDCPSVSLSSSPRFSWPRNFSCCDFSANLRARVTSECFDDSSQSTRHLAKRLGFVCECVLCFMCRFI